MKRVGYKFEKVYDIENLKLAHKNARKGKTKKAKHYYRYMDDIVILSNSKGYLHSLL